MNIGNLPEKKYYRIDQAAERLACTEDDIIHWGANDIISICAHAEDVYCESISDYIIERSTGSADSIIEEVEKLDIHMFSIALSSQDRKRKILISGLFKLNPASLITYEMTGSFSNSCSIIITNNDNILEYYPLSQKPKNLFIRSNEIEKFLSKKRQPPQKPTIFEINNFKSDKFSILCQAAQRFWSNADKNDKTTHPDNASVTKWLIERGYSETLAEKAATILRPEWAATGRRQEK
jgi:hypothetical protein